ncbi:hypothetical protein [Methylobacterium nodulans]|uniref:hypothetical protein n=1 Tax=Methylobacterium nodulans TaxID=114616 RepID=UPI000161846D|nr:hypothetical protein [Methylobacterium nodulans]
MINEAALASTRGRSLAGPALAAHPSKVFPHEARWRAHLTALGLDQLAITPDPVTIATEGALWGAIAHHGLLRQAVIVSPWHHRLRPPSAAWNQDPPPRIKALAHRSHILMYD